MGSIIQTEDINSVNSLISSEIGRGGQDFFSLYMMIIFRKFNEAFEFPYIRIINILSYS
jgi:hypothetical protein